MNSLQPYVERFDAAYPYYADEPYHEVRQLVAVYTATDAFEIVGSAGFARAVELIRPVIAIKNYKSQVPFPVEVVPAITCVMQIHCTAVDAAALPDAHRALLAQLLGFQGFRLPTASAVMHFCHPDRFPIVDVNVQGACAVLKARYKSDFQGLDAPRIPYQDNPDPVIAAYCKFIAFIDKVRELQAEHGTSHDYRYVDKALMVLGGDDRTRARHDR